MSTPYRKPRTVWILAVLLGLLLLANLVHAGTGRAARTPAAKQAWQYRWQVWLPDKWRRIAACETGLNWRHSNSSYQGAFGFATQSWDSFKPSGYPAEAWQATPWQQYVVARRIYARYGLSGWGCRNA